MLTWPGSCSSSPGSSRWWASLLPATERFSRLWPSVAFVAALVASTANLAAHSLLVLSIVAVKLTAAH